MKRRKRMTMMWRISLYLLGFTGILLAILWFTQILYLDSFYRGIKLRELNKAAEIMLDGIAKWSGDEQEMDELTSSVFKRYDISVILTDKDGHILYMDAANPFLTAIDPEEFARYYQSASQNGGSAEIQVNGDVRWFRGHEGKGMEAEGLMERVPWDDFRSPRPPESRSVISVNIILIDGQEYVLILKSLITPLYATISTLRVQLTYISGLMISLAIIISFFIARHLSEPIRKINASARGLVTGEYEDNFNGRGYQEVLELSDTLKETAKQLDRVESLRRELISNVSHDLRTPLTMIIAYAEMIRDLPGENTPENMQVVIEEAERLTNLVNDLLETSRAQADEKLEKIPYDLTESIKKVLGRYSRLISQDGYHIHFEYDEHVYVEADEYKIYQVIYNLVNNAVNYTGEDKRVLIRQIVSKRTVRIEVQDSGAGIDAKDLPYVWERYYKVDKDHTRGVMGTGLGLSIVRNVLKIHNAVYGVESTRGQGSTFWFEMELIPVTRDHSKI